MLTLVKLLELPSSGGRTDTTVAFLEDTEIGYFVITDVDRQWRRLPEVPLAEAKILFYKLDRFHWPTLESFLEETCKDKSLLDVDNPIMVCKIVKASIGKEESYLEDKIKQLEVENKSLKRQLTLSTPIEKTTPTKLANVPPVQKGTSLVNPRVKRAKAKGSLFSDDDS